MSAEHFRPQPERSELEKMWDTLPGSVRQLVEIQYTARDPKLTSEERKDRLSRGHDMLIAISDRGDKTTELQSYLRYWELAITTWGAMPPLPTDEKRA